MPLWLQENQSYFNPNSTISPSPSHSSNDSDSSVMILDNKDGKYRKPVAKKNTISPIYISSDDEKESAESKNTLEPAAKKTKLGFSPAFKKKSGESSNEEEYTNYVRKNIHAESIKQKLCINRKDLENTNKKLIYDKLDRLQRNILDLKRKQLEKRIKELEDQLKEM